ncbi:MAG: hypothetical protein CMC48_05675 [Flavobacteriaceae bacterium]|nr:hypothetical protein [Flavobacteriaceae bacterium]|tara:strand:- start:20025 stop:20369 length:345 start_codon:yes stop_codon:yes gene_type:complete
MRNLQFLTILFVISFTLIYSCKSEELESQLSIRPQYILTVTAGEGGSVIPDPSGTYNKGSTFTLTATPDEGYVADRWVGTDLRNPICGTTIRHCRCIVTLNSNRNVIAYFRKQE